MLEGGGIFLTKLHQESLARRSSAPNKTLSP